MSYAHSRSGLVVKRMDAKGFQAGMIACCHQHGNAMYMADRWRLSVDAADAAFPQFDFALLVHHSQMSFCREHHQKLLQGHRSPDAGATQLSYPAQAEILYLKDA